MMADFAWLAQQAQAIHDYFYSFFFALVTLLFVVGIVCEFFNLPLGMPAFAQLVGRVFIAAILLAAFPQILNAIADVTDSISGHLGDMNDFKTVLNAMSEKLHEFSWSWTSVKDSIMLLLSFLTFFLLYFSVHVANAVYLYSWTLMYVFSPLLIALYVLPVTAASTSALFRSLIEVACWKIVWSVLATLLWSAALGQINQSGAQFSFLTAICFNIILAGSLLLTPFVVHALAGGGIASMTKNVGAVAIGGLTMSPGIAFKKFIKPSGGSFLKDRIQSLRESKNSGNLPKGIQPKSSSKKPKSVKKAPRNQGD